MVLTQPTAPLGADLRHSVIHLKTGLHPSGQFSSHCTDEEKGREHIQSNCQKDVVLFLKASE